MANAQSDAAKFIELILGECDGRADAHSWRKCRRCLAIHLIECRDNTARRLLETAKDALRKSSEGKDGQ